jgi:hypothetical protein
MSLTHGFIKAAEDTVTEFTDFVQGFTSGYGGGTQAARFPGSGRTHNPDGRQAALAPGVCGGEQPDT